MGRRKSNNAIGYVAIGLIVLAFMIPKEAWILVGVVGAIWFVAWLYKNFSSEKSRTSDIPISVRVEYGGARIPERRTGPAIETRWIPQDQSVKIAGTTIPGGMIYVGSTLTVGHGEYEAAQIDPGLPVASNPVDSSQRLTDYWSRYDGITPQARRAYLDWLASGRSNPAANIGYVFLFFYGLERRVLMDAPRIRDIAGEIPSIAAEVRRLLQIYGENNSFRRYATHFLEFIEMQGLVNSGQTGKPPEPVKTYEISMRLRFALGQMAVSGKPVPADWALAWALSDPNIRLSKILQRCRDEFSILFQERYRANHGEGLKLSVNRTKLKLTYRPASPTLQQCELPTGNASVPDISAVISPVKKLQAVIDECTEALSAYARLLGRSPEKAKTIEGLLLLPEPLWPQTARTALDNLKSRIGTGMVAMTLGDLLASLNAPGIPNRETVRALARTLEAKHIGIEPDVIAGARAPKPEDQIVLFSCEPEDGLLRTTSAYLSAAVTMDLACSVASADAKICADELRFLSNQIDAWMHLSGAHRKRLRARLRFSMTNPPSMATLKKRLEPVTAQAKRAIAHLLSTLAQADGVVTPAEVKFLEKTYRALEQDVQQLYSDLHVATASPTALSPSAPAVQPVQPSVATPAGKGIVLDPVRIAALQKETQAVSALLASVFVEEAAEIQAEVAEDETAEEPVETGLLGLDAEHSAFLRLIITRAKWTRQELSDIAADLELMLDGALERINEAALDRLQAPIIEGGDELEIAQDLWEKMPA